jgi:hypothetical protein
MEKFIEFANFKKKNAIEVLSFHLPPLPQCLIRNNNITLRKTSAQKVQRKTMLYKLPAKLSCTNIKIFQILYTILFLTTQMSSLLWNTAQY